MHIAYDHQIFTAQECGGISRYFVELATRIAQREGTRATVVAPAYVNRHLAHAGPGLVVGRHVAPGGPLARLRRLENAWGTGAWLHAVRPEVVHETYYSARRLAPRRSRVVVTVHDMIPERFTAEFRGDPVAVRKAAAVARADHVICVSHNTRRDLLAITPVPAERVSVVHLGCDTAALTPVSPEPVVAGEYLLYVGRRGGYKNFDAVVSALARAQALLSAGVRLVAFGGGRLARGELDAARAAGLPASALIQLDGEDDVLANLYSHARALVYPSLYEGFGIPPLEAMALDCPVVCSNTSSLPEVVGDAAELFDPGDAASLAAALERVLLDGSRADALRRAGALRSAAFSWERCAAETAAVYDRLL